MYKGETFIAVPHERFGNQRVWSVTGSSLALGQLVYLHAMCNAMSAIKKAVAQDNQILYVELTELGAL